MASGPALTSNSTVVINNTQIHDAVVVFSADHGYVHSDGYVDVRPHEMVSVPDIVQA